jgi:hypothetical protein
VSTYLRRPEVILWPDEVWPQDIGALGVLHGSNLLDRDGSLRLEAARQAIEGRLHLLPRFHQVLYLPRRGLGGSRFLGRQGRALQRLGPFGWFGPAKRAGTVHGSRQVAPAITSNALRRSATCRASGPLTCVSCMPIVAMRWPRPCLHRDASQGGLQRADPIALRWMAERSEAVIPKTQRTHAGRDSGSLARAGGARGSRTVPGFTVAPLGSLSQCQRMSPPGRFVRPGLLQQPSGAQRRAHLDGDKSRPVPIPPARSACRRRRCSPSR